MATLAKLNVLLGMRTQGFYGEIERVRKRVKRLGRNLDVAGKQLTRGFTLPMVAAGAAATKMALSFDESMTKVVSLVGVAADQVASWQDDLLRMAGDTAKAPAELAEGLFFVTSAGMRGAQALEVLRAAAQASAVGLGSTATVADAVTSALNAYGASTMSAGEATAILVAAVREGKAAADDIAPALGRVLPVASQLGVGFDQVAASIAAMTRVGLDAAESSTALRAMLQTLLSPSAQASKALGQVGLSAEGLRAELAQNGLIAVLKKLRGAFGENEEALAKVFGNVRGLTGVLNLTGANAASTEAIFRSLAETTEQDLGKAFDVVASSPAFKFKQALAEIKATAVKLGATLLPALTPALDTMMRAGARIKEVFGSIPGPIRSAVGAVAALAAATGPLLVAMGAVASAAAALGAPLVLTVGAAVAAVALLVKHWEKVKPIVEAVVKSLKPVVAEAGAFIMEVFQKVKDLAAEIWPKVQALAESAFRLVKAAWDRYGGALVSGIETAWRAIKTTILVNVDAIGGIISSLASLLQGDVPGALEALKSAVSRIWGDIAQNFRAGAIIAEIAWWKLVKGIAGGTAAVLNNLAAVGRAFLALPFVDPMTKAAMAEGLKLAESGVASLTVAAGATELKIRSLKGELERMRDATSGAAGVMREESSAFITIAGAAGKAASSITNAFTQAGQRIEGSLSGGFGRGVEKGIAYGDQALRSWRDKLLGEPIRLRVELDLEEAQRQLRDLQSGRIPDTSGAVP